MVTEYETDVSYTQPLGWNTPVINKITVREYIPKYLQYNYTPDMRDRTFAPESFIDNTAANQISKDIIKTMQREKTESRGEVIYTYRVTVLTDKEREDFKTEVDKLKETYNLQKNKIFDLERTNRILSDDNDYYNNETVWQFIKRKFKRIRKC